MRRFFDLEKINVTYTDFTLNLTFRGDSADTVVLSRNIQS